MLLDFFGDLLTEKQQQYLNLYYNEDLSLSEIAETVGISRQGVRDIIVRAENLLLNMEEKTGVVKRWNDMREGIFALEAQAEKLLESGDDNVRAIAREMLDKLQDLKG